MIKVRLEQIVKDSISTEVHHFISSFSHKRAHDIPGPVRARWSVDTNLHSVLGVTFGEDLNRVRKRRG